MCRRRITCRPTPRTVNQIKIISLELDTEYAQANSAILATGRVDDKRIGLLVPGVDYEGTYGACVCAPDDPN